MHSSFVAKLLTEPHGDDAPIIHSFQVPSSAADWATASRQQSVAITRDDRRLGIDNLLASTR
jgi:hypothetical protein